MIRGDGIGIEICAHAIRGVRLAHDEPDRVVAAGDVVVHRARDDLAMLDALVRLHGRLGSTTASTRLAWFPRSATLQRLDVTGLNGPELNALRHQLAGQHDIVSTMLIDGAARRFMLALRWDHTTIRRLENLAERAGFVDVSVEPGPVSLSRVLPITQSLSTAAGTSATTSATTSAPTSATTTTAATPTTTAATTVISRRDAVDGESWVMVSIDGVPVAAGPTAGASRPAPGLTLAAATVSLHRLEPTLDLDELSAALDELTDHVLTHDGADHVPQLWVVGEPYPQFPAHDLRSTERQAVALGAAVGAAGLAGRQRPVDLVGPTITTSDEVARPWAVERIGDAPAPQRRRRRWRRRR